MDTPPQLLELVRSEARRLLARLPAGGAELGDLTGPGHLALLDAQARFDPRLGVPFEAFARQRIRGAMLDALRQLGPLSRRTLESIHRMARSHDVIASQSLPAPGAEAIYLAEAVGSLADMLLTEAALAMHGDEQASAEETLQDVELVGALRTAVAGLPEADREVLDAFYGDGTQNDGGAGLARRRGKSRSAISRAHLRILGDLRRAMEGSTPEAPA